MARPLRILVCVLLLLSAASFSAQASAASAEAWTGTDAQKIWGLMKVWAEVKYTFPHFERRPDLDWDATVQEYLPRVLAAKDMEAYYRVLLELTALLKDSHTAVLPPWGHLKPGYDLAPLEVRVLNDRFFLDRVGEDPALDDLGLRPGVEILEVDGVPVGTYFADNVLRFHAQGTPQADQATLLVYLLYGPAGTANALKIQDPDGQIRDVSVTRNAMSGDSPFMTRQLANAFAGPTIRTRTLPDGIIYVDIPNFEHTQARGDFEALIDSLDAATSTGLVIDLRYNMGGSSAICDPMIACLIDRTVPGPTMKFRHFIGAHEAWGQPPTWESTHHDIQPRQGPRYLGPVVVLTGGLTNSSAEDFAITLQAAGRATLMGQTTAGGAGNSLTSDLPGGGTLRVATFTALTPGGLEYVGTGVAPDIPVQPTREDLQAGRDPVLDQARAFLAK